VLLSLIYVFTRIDWRMLIREKKLRWVAKATVRPQSSTEKPSN